ncbi:MAG: discoidin domain-containing protein [Syntrophothermus sp.]
MAYTNDLIYKMTSGSAPYGAITGSSQYNTTYPPYKAVDDDNTTYWRTTTAGCTPCWITYQIPSTEVFRPVTKYTITANSATDCPITWQFYGSLDGTTFVLLDSQTDVVAFTAGEKREYAIVNTTNYSYYRLYIIKNGGATTTAVAEFELMATTADTSDVSIAGVSMQVEVDFMDVQIAGVTMQVEIDEGFTNNGLSLGINI